MSALKSWAEAAPLLVGTAMGRSKADTVIRNGRWVNVHSGEIIPGTDIAIAAGRFAYVGPDAAHTIRSVSKYETAMEELRTAVGPELDLIESRIVGPIKELQQVMKTIRKTITKRDHKVRRY